MTSVILNTNAKVATMSSLELVTLINEAREDGKKQLLHKNFIVKIENHPGIDSAKFLAQYKDSTGRSLKCYHLPKRECELMVMSESLAVQPKAMFAWLQTNDWIYRRPGGVWCAYQDRIKSGMLTHKITTVSRSDGTEKIVEQVLVTAKGLAKLAEVTI